MTLRDEGVRADEEQDGLEDWGHGEGSGVNGIAYGAISGKKLDPAKVSGADGKEKLVAALQASLTFCDAGSRG